MVQCQDIYFSLLLDYGSIYELQCVAVCCSVLQCVAVCCSALQCVAVCCSVLQCVAMCLYCVAVMVQCQGIHSSSSLST